MFDWDEAKYAANIAKHGVGFARAVRIFEGPVWTFRDDRFDYGEVRDISIGPVDGTLSLVVVHTRRAGATRVISARPANRTERRRYEEEVR